MFDNVCDNVCDSVCDSVCDNLCESVCDSATCHLAVCALGVIPDCSMRRATDGAFKDAVAHGRVARYALNARAYKMRGVFDAPVSNASENGKHDRRAVDSGRRRCVDTVTQSVDSGR